jgi:hypothetical protein
MGHALDVTFDVQTDDAGRAAPPKWAARAIRHALDARKGTPTRVRIGEPVRTRPQDRLYFAYLQRISLAYYESGRQLSKDDLHRDYKRALLPIVAASIEQATGEVVDIGKVYRSRSGEEEIDYSITGLSKEAMSLFIDLIAADSDVVKMGVPFPTDRETEYA